MIMGRPVMGPRGRQFGPLYLVITLSALVFVMASLVKADPPRPPLPAPAPPWFSTNRTYIFEIYRVNYTVNGVTKAILTVNGSFPGPPILANEGDHIIVNVTNKLSPSDNSSGITIHFHGTRQERSPFMDGVAYVSMCPILPGDYFVHEFDIPRQKGTLLWHAHIGWLRNTLHGAFITTPYTPAPYGEHRQEETLIISEWYNDDIQYLEEQGVKRGLPFREEAAMLINGLEGPSYPKSSGTYTLTVEYGKTYLLRLINANVNNHIYFSVASHTLTVVEADAEYLQPFQTDYVFLSPGQTTNVILTADQQESDYMILVGQYGRGKPPGTTGILSYDHPRNAGVQPIKGFLPQNNDTAAFEKFTNELRGLYAGRVPLGQPGDPNFTEIRMTVGLGTRVCDNEPGGDFCTLSDAPTGSPAAAPFYGWEGHTNNYTFKLPSKTNLMTALWYKIPGVYTEDYPFLTNPQWDYLGQNQTGIPNKNILTTQATRVIPIEFNSTLQIIMQDTIVLGVEEHPFHLHGHNFYILGQGYGNFDNVQDRAQFNTWDPPLRNTVSIPTGGWAAIRLKANNPGMWLFHCHLDKHTSWGMMVVLHVKDTTNPNHSMYGPPAHRPKCLNGTR